MGCGPGAPEEWQGGRERRVLNKDRRKGKSGVDKVRGSEGAGQGKL